MKKQLTCLGFVLISFSTMADDWEGKGELGYVLVGGNTESEVLNLGVEFSKKQDKWNHEAKLAAVKATSNDVDSAESYSAGWRSEYDLSERSFAFGDLRYFDDKFDSFEEIYTAAAGYGYKVLLRENLTWELSAGVGYRDTTIEVTQEDIGSIAYLLESNYKHTLSETAKFENYTRAEIADDNTFSQNKTSIAVSINSALALKASHEVRHNSDPAPGFKSVDRITSINIVYSF